MLKFTVAAVFGLIIAILVVREWFLPNIHRYTDEISAVVERNLGAPVQLKWLSASWRGLRPEIKLGSLVVLDEAGEPSLTLQQVEATLAWSSVWKRTPHFHQLVLHQPAVSISRDAQGKLWLAGFALPDRKADDPLPEDALPPAVQWLLSQRELRVFGATVTWSDETRDQPPLEIKGLDLRWSAGLDRYRFGAHMRTEASVFDVLDVRGEWLSVGPEGFSGRLYLAVDGLDSDSIGRRLDLPAGVTGYGDVRMWLDIDRNHLLAATFDLALSDLSLNLVPDAPALRLVQPSGRFVFEGRKGHVLSTSGFTFQWENGEQFGPLEMELRALSRLDALAEGGYLRINRLDLTQFGKLLTGLPVDASLREQWVVLNPEGLLDGLQLDWKPGEQAFARWTAKADLREVGWQALGDIPGLTGLSGRIEGDQQRGRFRLAVKDGAVSLPEVFPSSDLRLDQARIDGGWRQGRAGLEVVLDDMRFSNPDTQGTASGIYRSGIGALGEIDLAARLTGTDGTAVPRYLPKVLNPHAREWLERALEGGHVPEARLRLRGRLDEFPFDDGEDGQFLVTAKVVDAQLNYAPGWPVITGIHGDLRFEGPGMLVTADRATLAGVALQDVAARIATFMNPDDRLLEITGKAQGTTQNFLGFIASSPVRGYINGMTDGFKATGDGVLDLAIDIPLEDVDKATTRGEYRFSGNRLNLFDELPALENANGRVQFTERSFALPEARARFLGEPVTVTASEASGGKTRFVARGAANMQMLNQWLDQAVLLHLSGTTPWHAEIALVEKGADVSVTTDLRGVSSSLPAPFNKRTTDEWLGQFLMRVRDSGAQRSLSLSVPDRIEAALDLRGTGNATQLVRGGLAVKSPLDMKDRGVKVTVRLNELDLDAWQRALALDASESRALPVWLAGTALAMDLDVGDFRVAGLGFKGLELGAMFDPISGWRGQVVSDRLKGGFAWNPDGGGRVEARLERASLGEQPQTTASARSTGDDAARIRRLPAMDLEIDAFEWSGRPLGRLKLNAELDGNYWRLRKLELHDENGRIDASGRWLMGGYPVTELDVKLDVRHLGRWLGNWGQGDVISGGRANAEGRLSWFGLPFKPDLQSLSGGLDVKAESGQFRQLEPGVGRVLGVLSLQALPRRLSLDFRDVFSDGFAFDQLAASITMDRGVLLTDDLAIAGPAARVWIKGSVDALNETQDLDVMVQPTLTESVAIGAAAGLLNPAAGVLALLAQRVLADPVERMFAYHYHLTGSWTEPHVQKRSSPRTHQQESR